LEEMQHVAGEMQRDDYFRIKKIPLLIGGATTSRVHTAVKISPHYEGPVVYVPDASRSVSVCSDLLSDEKAAAYLAELKADYEKVRQQHANKKATPLVSLAQARANKTRIDWAQGVPPAPKFIGRRVFKNYDLAELALAIDWGPFFQTWDLAGPFPGILTDEIVGESARRVLSDGQRMLKALADRLAEAFAERLHQRVRTELWGYASDEALTNAELIAEKYRGIRPAPGYPACPDHTVKAEMFRVLRCDEIGMGLTESLAMTPAASVSGFYIAHPQ